MVIVLPTYMSYGSSYKQRPQGNGYRGNRPLNRSHNGRGGWKSGFSSRHAGSNGYREVNEHDNYHSASQDHYESSEYENSRRGQPHRVSTPSSDTEGRNMKKQEPVICNGTDPKTGENANDAKFPKLLHHIDFFYEKHHEQQHKPRNYRVMYDPELDKSLSKNDRKTANKKIRFNGEGVDLSQVTDPRKANVTLYFQKPNKASKKFPFKQLPQAKWGFDKDSVGPPPQTELVVWDLPSTVSEVYLTNFFKSYGDPIKDMNFLNDPINAVPLGVATFRFQGSSEKAMALAKKLITRIKAENTKIDGEVLKIGLNDHNKELLNRKIDAAMEKLRHLKNKLEEEEARKQRAKRQQLEAEEKKRKEEELRKEKEQRDLLMQKQKLSTMTTKYKPNTTTLSVRNQRKVVPGIFLPNDLDRYVKERPYVLIRDKHVSTRRIPSLDIKRLFNKYGWTRVLTDRSGFFIVFNSLKECEKLFLKEDGRRFYNFRMYMELCVPQGYDPTHGQDESDFQSKTSTPSGSVDVIEEAMNILLKDFQSFLSKDIHERVIAPEILDLLSHDKYPELAEELKRKEAANKAQAAAAISASDRLKQDAMSVLAKQRQQQLLFKMNSFRKDKKSGTKRKNLIPMQHALNYDSSDEGEDDVDDEGSHSPEKRSRDEDLDTEVPSKRSKKSRLALLYENSSDEEADGDTNMEDVETPGDEAAEESGIDEIDYSKLDAKYQPTEGKPMPVYPEKNIPCELFDISALQEVIKDDEDLKFAQMALEDVEASKHSNLSYWAWKQKDNAQISSGTAEEVELVGQLDSRFDSTTGSFRSDGYRKIPEADKIHYLPHRRRRADQPIKTVQHEGDDDGTDEGTPMESRENTSNNNGGIQSSRVNRANNRRFAADITAQLGTETEALSLNALTKRKKPVTFARSAIHNWGLYALEPIAAKEMIIEYVGESIRQQVSENRERSYLKTGIGSSYLFRVDENTVIDATKKGGIARFINHCCDPSCTAKIIKVEGKKRIVIYALKDIEANEELTYDYKFERETNDEERIRCLCGAAGCKGYLN